jgi:hypothetical protein
MALLLTTPVLAAKVDRSRPNIYKGGTWNLSSSGVAHVTKDGISSLSVSSRGGSGVIFRSPKFAVSSGKQHTCVVDFKGDVWPSTSIRISVSLYNGNTHLGNVKEASTWMYRKGEEGKWQEAPIVFNTKNATHALMLMSRFEDSNQSKPTFLSKNIHCHEGNHWIGNPDPKIPFNGSFVKVTSTGEVTIDGKPTFLRCAFPDNNDPNRTTVLKRHADAGFNCNMWAANATQTGISVNAGLKYVFIALAPYYHYKTHPKEQKGWGYNNLELMEKNIKGVLAKYGKNVVGYYCDDEANSQYLLMEKIFKLIDQWDRDAEGKRQRPIYCLEGNPGTALQHLHHIDVVGTYVGGDTGGEGSGSDGHQILNWADGMNRPVVFAQFNKGSQIVPSKFYLAETHGASALGFWSFKRHETPWNGSGIYAWYPKLNNTINTILSQRLNPRYANIGEEPPVVEESPEDPPITECPEVDVCDEACQKDRELASLVRQLMEAREAVEEIKHTILQIETDINTIIK